jgi:mannose/fructose/N-acetylgalactosamine-specific phosphotransferase system component IIC
MSTRAPSRRQPTAAAAAVAQAVSAMPDWARRTVYVCGGVLFAAGFAMSAMSLTVLMELFGVLAPFSYSLFLAADAGATVGLMM